MKKIILIILSIIIHAKGIGQKNVGIGTTNPNPNAILDMKTNNKGILIPRLNTLEQNNLSIGIGNSENGLMIYNIDSLSFSYWNGIKWTYFPSTNSGSDNQQLSLNNDTIFLERGGNIKLPQNNDNDSTNEIQNISISNDTILLQNGGFVKLPSGLIDTDNQTLVLSNDTLFIQDGNFVKLPSGTINTDSQQLSISNDTILLQNGGLVKLPSGLIDTDNQNLVLSNDTLFIQDGNFVKLPSGTINTDSQQLSISNDTILLQNGGLVKLPEDIYWNTTGNVATNSANNFLGTTDNQDLVFKTNNTESFRIKSDGIISVNNQTPPHPFSRFQVSETTIHGIYSESNLGAGGLYYSDSSHGIYAQTKGDPLQSNGLKGMSLHNNGTGVVGGGNGNLIPQTYVLPQGSGGSFTGYEIGVFGNATNSSANYTFGGYFANNSSYAYVGGWDNFSFIDYKILGSGAVSTIIKDEIENDVVMFCSESPEIVFEDYGTGTLTNGKAFINLDPILSKNIIVNENHPIKVFIQEEGECNGLYVTNKSQNGFNVIEKNNGNTNISFSWRIVANRKNKLVKTDNGEEIYTKYEQARFPKAPKYIKPNKQKENATYTQKP